VAMGEFLAGEKTYFPGEIASNRSNTPFIAKNTLRLKRFRSTALLL
jgi:hypothetical protein